MNILKVFVERDDKAERYLVGEFEVETIKHLGCIPDCSSLIPAQVFNKEHPWDKEHTWHFRMEEIEK